MSVVTLAASPEQALAAAIVKQAAEDARAGCAEARRWLAGRDCLAWLDHLVPPGTDAAGVQAALLRTLPD